MTMVSHPDAALGRRLANNDVVVPGMKMHQQSCLKGQKWVESFLPTMNTGISAGLASLDPVETIKSDPMASEMHIEAINAKSTCGYVLKDFTGLKTQQFKDVHVDNDFPCGLGQHCWVCTDKRSKACGDKCIPVNDV